MQCVFAVILTITFYLFNGQNSALSSLLGSLVFIAPQQYFAFKAFRHMGASRVTKTIQNFYSAESSKQLLVAAGFALVFSFYKEADVLALMTSFIVLVIVNGVSPLMLAK